MQLPKVSVVVPVYNGGRFLKGAVLNLLAQGYPNLEIVVVNDGSTDDTAEVAASLGSCIRFFSQPNQGPSPARNQGVQHSTGELVAFLDVDDLLTESAITRYVAAFEANKQADVVMMQMQLMKITGYKDEHETVPEFEFYKDPFYSYHVGTVMVRRAVFDKIGYLDESIRICEDVDWFMRMREHKLHLVMLPHTAMLHRRHDTNMTLHVQKGGRDLVSVLRKSLERRKAEGKAEDLPRMSGFEQDSTHATSPPPTTL